MKLDTLIEKKALNEGLKLDRANINDVLNDPHFRCGFELEFIGEKGEEPEEDFERDDEDEDEDLTESIRLDEDAYSLRDMSDILMNDLDISPQVYTSPGQYKPNNDADESDWANDNTETLELSGLSFDSFSDLMEVISAPEYDSDLLPDRMSQLFHALFANQGELFGMEFDGNENNDDDLFDYLKHRLGVARLAVLMKCYPRNIDEYPAGGYVFPESLERDFGVDSLAEINEKIKDFVEELNIRDDKQVNHVLGYFKGVTEILNPHYVSDDERANSEAESENVYSDWILTSDESISHDGFELVSPVQTLNDTLSDIERLFDWMKDNNFTTDKSCGFHVSMSYGDRQRTKNVDYLKLGLLMDEEAILRKFQRLNDRFTVSQIAHVRGMIANELRTGIRSEGLDAMLDRLRGFFNTDKYTSINIAKLEKYGYLEFRIMGGARYHERFPEVRKVILRYAVCLKAALDPNAFRKIFLKKLYTVLETKNKNQEEQQQLITGDPVAKTLLNAAANPDDVANHYKLFKSHAAAFKQEPNGYSRDNAVHQFVSMLVSGLGLEEAI